MYYTSAERPQPGSITIRLTRPIDSDEIRRIAERDSQAVPDGEMLVAIVEGEIRAAISLANGGVIADPFHRTEELVRMLTLQRSQIEDRVPGPRRGLRRLRPASS